MFHIGFREFVAVALVVCLLAGAPPARGQDVVTSEDFSGGASVYSFKENRKAKKRSAAVKKGYLPRRNASKRKRARQRLAAQVAASRSRSTRPRFKKVDPANVAKSTPKTAAARSKAALESAGAGETYLDAGDNEAAIAAFDRSLQLNPKFTDAKLGLSEAYARRADELAEQGRSVEAMTAYQNALKQDSFNTGAYAGLGSLYEAQDNSTLAIANYEKAVVADAGLTDVDARLGVLYYEQGEVAKAETHLVKADAADPQNPETKLYLGLVGLKQNDHERATRELDQAVKLDPNYAEAYYYRGAANSRQAADDKAIADYQKAVFIDSGYTDAAFDLATAEYNLERYGQAAESYQKVIATDDSYADAHVNLAESYRQLEDYPKANAQYGVAAGLVKDDPELYSSWGYCLGKEEKWDTAADRLETASEIRGDAVDYSNLGWAYNHGAEADLKAGREKEANAKLTLGRDSAQKATEKDSNFAAGFVNLGTSLNGLKDYQNASNALRRAVQLHDDWYFAHNELGRAYRGLGQLADAVAAFRRVTTLNDKFAYGFFNLGEAQYASGDKKGAEKTMKALRKLDPALAGRLDSVLKGKIDEQKRKAEDKLKDKTINKLPRIPF